MKRDIETRADIDLLLAEFYKVVPFDSEIGHHFEGVDLAAPLPVIANFWEKILFGNQVYFGDPLAIHKMLDKRSPLTPEHFARWIAIFQETIDASFDGPIAEIAKLQAKTIGDSLYRQLNASTVSIERSTD